MGDVAAERTALAKLEDAVREFWAETRNVDSMVTGWVMGFSTVRFKGDGDPDWASDQVPGMQYVIGESTHIAQSAGIVRFLDVVHERTMYAMLSSSDSGDES